MRVPTGPAKIGKNRKPESHAEEPHCSVHVILFTALSATPSTFNSSSNILFVSPLSLTRSRLNQELVVNNALREQAGSGTGRGLDTYVHIPLTSKFCLVNLGVTSWRRIKSYAMVTCSLAIAFTKWPNHGTKLWLVASVGGVLQFYTVLLDGSVPK